MPTFKNNLALLLYDLRQHGYHMTAFKFKYNGSAYIVLFEDNGNIEDRRNRFALVVLTFIDLASPDRRIVVEANRAQLIFASAEEFRKFFGIRYSNNLGDIFKQFYDRLLEFIPPTAPEHLDKELEIEVARTLASRGQHNPYAIYCYDARRLGKRNGSQMHRSIFISNLAELRKRNLYDYFRLETTVTFYFSTNPEDELDDIDIINRFIARENDRRYQG